jgi:signal peptidase I
MTINQMTKTRRPRRAVAASFVLPGLGQIYNGEGVKGLSILLLTAFIVPTFGWISTHGPRSLISFFVFFGVATALAFYCFAAIDAYKVAERVGEKFAPTPFNNPFSYLALTFSAYFFVFGQLAEYTQNNLVSAYKVPTTSMTPGILQGDQFFADKTINRPGSKGKIQRGDIVVFVNPNDRTQTFVKRVIGLPGDKIDLSGTSINVNGQLLTQGVVKDLGNGELNRLLRDHIATKERTSDNEYVVLWNKNPQQISESISVPNGQIFVLGDNRDSTIDSRKFGGVPLSDVVGRAEQVWFSTAETGIRWGRIGTLLAIAK